jgi:hypothetical protein
LRRTRGVALYGQRWIWLAVIVNEIGYAKPIAADLV